MNTILQRVAPIGEAREREMLKDAASYVYQERPQGPVQAHVFFPPATHAAHPGPRPLIVFFHGGFWDVSALSQFVPHCLHFASRGAVAVVAQTRTLHKHGTFAPEAIEDARDLIRWLRFNHDTFDIDPGKLVVSGSGGGATSALLTGMPKPKALFSSDGISCLPDAMILFSALVDPSRHHQASERYFKKRVSSEWNPMRLHRRKMPPMIFFHGKSDRVTPFSEVEKFRRKARFRGNQCQLIPFERADHSFFNFNVNSDLYGRTIRIADQFLTQLGILRQAPEEEIDF